MTEAPKKGRGAATTWAATQAVLDWLERPNNFKLITGSAAVGQPMGAGKPLKKADGYRMMAEYVNKRCNYENDPTMFWDANKCKSRYESLYAKYSSTKRAYNNKCGDKFTLTMDEVASGMTIDDKLNTMCYKYQVWDRLFGDRCRRFTLVNSSSA
jgi:hypothetical protein